MIRVCAVSLLAALPALGLIQRDFTNALNQGLIQDPNLFGAADDGFDWFEGQLVDHFTDGNEDTWAQRYVINTTSWKAGGPVFLVLGGEGPLSTGYVGGHFITGEWSEEFGAMIIGLEHRFYGESMPIPTSSPDDLRLLSSQQALADAAYFRNYLVQTFNGTLDASQWVVFGGSYSGALAAWAREKYPFAFQGAFASSGPVNAIEDFTEYLDVVAEVVDEECLGDFESAVNTVEGLLKSKEGRKHLSLVFNTCTPIESGSEKDIVTFLSHLIDPVCGVVQYNRDGGKTTGTIEDMCAAIKAASDPVVGWAKLAATGTEGKCMDFSYQSYLDSMNATSAGRSWTWQTCTEFGYFQTGGGELSGRKNPFFKAVDLAYFTGICKDLFGAAVPADAPITRTNSYYGGLGIKASATNTYFGDGTVDPWHRLAVVPQAGRDLGGASYEHLHYDSAAVLINGTAHCADLYGSTANDLEGLTKARGVAKKLIRKWIVPSEIERVEY